MKGFGKGGGVIVSSYMDPSCTYLSQVVTPVFMGCLVASLRDLDRGAAEL